MEVCKLLNPETALFIISSKTFTTQETMTNARSVRRWFIDKTGDSSYVKEHFVAVSSNFEEAKKFGIDNDNVFVFWDWVGGRYSIWSAIGLSVACIIGYKNFKEFLEGANAMDRHFYNTPFEKNIPVILALISIWYINFFDARSECILVYNYYLRYFMPYIQQLNMESNGKSVDREGNIVNYSTAPIIWGQPGSNSQHAFFQSLHQGTNFIPCDFLISLTSFNDLDDHNVKNFSNFFSPDPITYDRKKSS